MSDFVAPGEHLIIDLYGASNLTCMKHVEAVLRQRVEIIGATLLKMELHSFGEGGGVTGVAILSESHISIHTWPELDFVAIDIFACGKCNASLALDFIRDQFQAKEVVTTKVERGSKR